LLTVYIFFILFKKIKCKFTSISISSEQTKNMF
jgi:hypothetical protein